VQIVHIKPSPSGVDVLEDVALTRLRIALFPCHRYPNAIAAAGPKLTPPISMAATASPPTTKPILAIRVVVLSAHQRDYVKVDINASAEFLDRKQRGRLRIGQRCCPAISKPRDQKRGNQFRSACGNVARKHTSLMGACPTRHYDNIVSKSWDMAAHRVFKNLHIFCLRKKE
jgi:hypothetical protein